MDRKRDASGAQGGDGVSAGALIAPLALLGPRYDDVLRQVYTSIG
jgi:hypothetical protein